jgi:hypothetical protein
VCSKTQRESNSISSSHVHSLTTEFVIRSLLPLQKVIRIAYSSHFKRKSVNAVARSHIATMALARPSICEDAQLLNHVLQDDEKVEFALVAMQGNVYLRPLKALKSASTGSTCRCQGNYFFKYCSSREIERKCQRFLFTAGGKRTLC